MEECRKQFEKWARSADVVLEWEESNGVWFYMGAQTDLAWAAWQEAWEQGFMIGRDES